MLTPRELVITSAGAVGRCRRGVLPVFDLCLRLLRGAPLACAVEAWRLASASAIWAREERGAHCSWWWREVNGLARGKRTHPLGMDPPRPHPHRPSLCFGMRLEVLKRAGMDQHKMRAMILQRWRLHRIAAALYAWR